MRHYFADGSIPHLMTFLYGIRKPSDVVSYVKPETKVGIGDFPSGFRAPRFFASSSLARISRQRAIKKTTQRTLKT